MNRGEPTEEQREAWELAQIRQRRSRLHAKPIGSVMRRLMSSSGYGETQAVNQLQQQWQAAVGPTLAKLTQPGNVRRGTLLVWVANSAVMQELHMRKRSILASLQGSVPQAHIRDLNLRVEIVDGVGSSNPDEPPAPEST